MVRMQTSSLLVSVFAEQLQTESWDPNKTAELLSNNNLTATLVVGGKGYGVVGASTGKKYWEMRVDIGDPNTSILPGAGIGIPPYAAVDLGNDSNESIGWQGNGIIRRNSGNIATIQTFTTTDICCIALDIDNNKIWFRTNNGNWNNDILANQNPATNTGGFDTSALTPLPLYPAFGLNSAGGDQITANFGATPYAQTPPAGFGNW